MDFKWPHNGFRSIVYSHEFEFYCQPTGTIARFCQPTFNCVNLINPEIFFSISRRRRHFKFNQCNEVSQQSLIQSSFFGIWSRFCLKSTDSLSTIIFGECRFDAIDNPQGSNFKSRVNNIKCKTDDYSHHEIVVLLSWPMWLLDFSGQCPFPPQNFVTLIFLSNFYKILLKVVILLERGWPPWPWLILLYCEVEVMNVSPRFEMWSFPQKRNIHIT